MKPWDVFSRVTGQNRLSSVRVSGLFRKFARSAYFPRFSEGSPLLTLALAVGLTSGIGVWLFREGIDIFQRLFREGLADEVLAPWFGPLSIVIALGIAGLLVGGLMQRFVGEERHHGVAGIMEAVTLGGGRLRYRRMPAKALASAMSLGAGASLGPEDPSVQIGANLGSFFGQRLHLSEEQVRLLVGAGSASAIAAAFKAPIAGVFFALEVILNGEFSTASFGIVVLAAVVSSVFTQAVESAGAEMGILNYTMGSPLEIPFYVLLGLVMGPIAALFIRAVYWQHDLWHRYVHLSRPFKTALAGVLVGLVAIALPDILGTGRETMNVVLNGTDTKYTFALLVALGLAKFVMTTVSLGGGFVGGVFAPTLFIGTMLGGAFGRAVNLVGAPGATGDPQSYAIAGMAAMMAGVVRAPITAVLLVFELTNDYRLILPIMLTAVICVYVAEHIEPHGVYALGLLRKGIRLPQGRDVDVMQTVTVAEVMTAPAPTIVETASLVELRDSLRAHNARSMCVVDGDGRLVGVVTLADLQRAYESGSSAALRVADILTREMIIAHPDDLLWKAIRSMGTHNIGQLPVVTRDTQDLLGLLRRQDVMRAYNVAIARKRKEQHLSEQIRLHTLTGAHVFELPVTEGSPAANKRIREIHWPIEATVASVRRAERLIVPHGETELRAGDWLTIVAVPEVENELVALLQGPPREAPPNTRENG